MNRWQEQVRIEDLKLAMFDNLVEALAISIARLKGTDFQFWPSHKILTEILQKAKALQND